MSKRSKLWCLGSFLLIMITLSALFLLYFHYRKDNEIPFVYLILATAGPLALSFFIMLPLRMFYERFGDFFDIFCNLLALVGVTTLRELGNTNWKTFFLVCASLLFVEFTVLAFHWVGAYTSKERRFRNEQFDILKGERVSLQLFDDRKPHRKWREKYQLTADCETIFPGALESGCKRIDGGARDLYSVRQDVDLSKELRSFLCDGKRSRSKVLFLTGSHSCGKTAALLDAVNNRLNGFVQRYEIPVYIDLYDWLCGTREPDESDRLRLDEVKDFHKQLESGQKVKLRRQLLTDMFRVYYDDAVFSPLIDADGHSNILFVFDSLEKVLGNYPDEQERKEYSRDLILSLFDLIGDKRCIISCAENRGLDAYYFATSASDGRKCQVVKISGISKNSFSKNRKELLTDLTYDEQRMICSNVTMAQIWDSVRSDGKNSCENGLKCEELSRYTLLDAFINKKLENAIRRMRLSSKQLKDVTGREDIKEASEACIRILAELLAKEKNMLSPYTAFGKDDFNIGIINNDLITLYENSELISVRSDGRFYISNVHIYEYLITFAIFNNINGITADLVTEQLKKQGCIANADLFMVDIYAMYLENSNTKALEEICGGDKERWDHTESLLRLAERITDSSYDHFGILLTGNAILKGEIDNQNIIDIKKSREADDKELLMLIRAFHLLSDDDGEIRKELTKAVFASDSLFIKREWLRTVSASGNRDISVDERDYGRFLLQEYPYYIRPNNRGWNETVLSENCRMMTQKRLGVHSFTFFIYYAITAALLVQSAGLIITLKAMNGTPSLEWVFSCIIKFGGFALVVGSIYAWFKQWKKPVYVYGLALSSVSDMFTMEEFLAEIMKNKDEKAGKVWDSVLILSDWLSNRPSIVLIAAAACCVAYLPCGNVIAALACGMTVLVLIPSAFSIFNDSNLKWALIGLIGAFLLLSLLNESAVWSGCFLLFIVMMVWGILGVFSRRKSKYIWNIIRERKDSSSGKTRELKEQLEGLKLSAAAQLRLLYVAFLYSDNLKDELDKMAEDDLNELPQDYRVYEMLQKLKRGV